VAHVGGEGRSGDLFDEQPRQGVSVLGVDADLARRPDSRWHSGREVVLERQELLRVVYLPSDDPTIESGGVDQELLDGHGLWESRRNSPTLEVRVGVGSQVQESGIDELQHGGSCQGCGERGGMDEGTLGIHRHSGGDVGESVAPDEQGPPAFDQSHHQTGHALSLQPVGGQSIDVEAHESRAGVREPRRLLRNQRLREKTEEQQNEPGQLASGSEGLEHGLPIYYGGFGSRQSILGDGDVVLRQD